MGVRSGVRWEMRCGRVGGYVGGVCGLGLCGSEVLVVGD